MVLKKDYMVIERLNTEELFSSLDETWATFLELVSSVDEQDINIAPFEGSWTVAQLATHVIKSNKAIVQALQMQGKPCNRNADERTDDLKKIFLDFTVKFQSPEFIIPEKKEYKKGIVVEQLESSIEQLKQWGAKANLYEIIMLPAFGELTKFEILYFVLVHTQRHLRQLKNILSIINKKN
ncbi:MAG TPA: DinB family protein [Parafilimonas sp.]|nr:DinB family protein [Parafilimonas sp.]